jgi:hypothetical protein
MLYGVKREDRDDWIVTYTGKRFWPLDPDFNGIDIADIAHALSNTCRFTGHTSEFYSVAQHSVLVSSMCPDAPLYGLLHDASEAYLCDIARPVKHSDMFSGYREAEAWLQSMILLKFGILNPRVPVSVKEVDGFIAILEGVSFMPKHKGAFWNQEREQLDLDDACRISPWSPHRAEERFLQRFALLYNGGHHGG